MEYTDWLKRAEQSLTNLYGIDLVDIGLDGTQLIDHYRTWPDHTEFVEWFANKYDLDRLP